MDWIRRNWPDLLIGVALVAVIAMIVATLLSGGSLTSLLRRNTAPDIPITTTTGPNNGGQTTATPDSAAGTQTQGQNTPGNATTSANGGNGAAGGTAAQNGNLDVFVPGTTDAPGTGASGAQNGATTPGDAASQNTDATSAQTGTGPAAANPAGAANVNAPLPESVINGGFRVAAGAVDSRDSALAAAQTFRDAGYTVTVEPQDDLFLLWIGPYASDAGAERVVSQLQDDGLVPDALVYTYDPNEAPANAGNAGAGNAGPNNTEAGNAQAGGGEGAAATTPANAGPANANTGNANGGSPAADVLTPPAGQRFLQVGAYRSDESAAPQREQLEGLGLSVTSDEDASGIVRLYVGPFAGAQLAQTQNRLSSQGIDSFPVTP